MYHTAHECVSEHGKTACKELGGECITEQDGYYIVSALCIGFGVISVLFFLIPTARKLQGSSLPPHLRCYLKLTAWSIAVPVCKWRVYS